MEKPTNYANGDLLASAVKSQWSKLSTEQRSEQQRHRYQQMITNRNEYDDLQRARNRAEDLVNSILEGVK
jgi:hypothetical protein